METYQPGSFKDVYESALGQAIWNYLNSEDAKIRMVLTSELGHPAAEGIGDVLLLKLGEEVKNDRVKQATGHMIRHIMESIGFVHAQRSVPCRKKKEVYTFASRYQKSKSK